jgi:acyl-coenzyme A thioesterase PaaI-like protein
LTQQAPTDHAAVFPALLEPAVSQISVADFQTLIDAELPLVGLFGIRTSDIGHGQARMRMHFNPGLIRPGGTIAGPALMALADVTLHAASEYV